VRPRVKLDRRPGLFDDALAQDDDGVGHCHRLDLIMRHVDHRRTQPPVEADDLAAHFHAQFGVEIGKRLVKQKSLRLLDDRATDGDALALAARKLRGPAMEEMRNLQNVRRSGDARLDLFFRQALADQPKRRFSRTLICG
jgi:hypothetical protein